MMVWSGLLVPAGLLVLLLLARQENPSAEAATDVARDSAAGGSVIR